MSWKKSMEKKDYEEDCKVHEDDNNQYNDTKSMDVDIVNGNKRERKHCKWWC